MSTSRAEDDAEDNPALNKVIERNIRTIIRLRLKTAGERSMQDRIADIITAFSGRMGFVYVHIVWFGLWILVNTGRFGVRVFDPFPYGLLTMVVSLEAIFLSTFVLISQNRMSEEIEHRADLDLHIGLLTEHELTRVLQMLDAIQAKWVSKTMRPASWQTLKWKPSPKMCWLKSSAFSVERSGETAVAMIQVRGRAAEQSVTGVGRSDAVPIVGDGPRSTGQVTVGRVV